MATYNRAEHLRLALACLLRQDYPGPLQAVVADDGSTDHTEDVIEETRRAFRHGEMVRVWQEHDGFRKSMVVNEAVRRARGDLLVFLDGDCMPALNLVSTYVAEARANAFYLGGVYRLSREFTEGSLRTAPGPKPVELLRRAAEPANQVPGQRGAMWMRYWKSRLYAALGIRKPRIWGGNFAVNRDVFEKVNGFDENYVGWGQEDSDLRTRLLMGGHRPVCLHVRAVAYHLWHERDAAARVRPGGGTDNRGYYERRGREAVCRNGLRKLAGRSG